LAGAPYPDAVAGVVSAARVVREFELQAASATALAIAAAIVPARSAVRFMIFLLRFGTRPDQHARHAAGARVLRYPHAQVSCPSRHAQLIRRVLSHMFIAAGCR
jgi:hypothetical protein